MSVPTSADDSILSKRARSTFRILPFKGRIACVRRSLPCFADPPAESPSTMNNSDRAGSFSWQSASLPGSPATSSAPLRRVISRAFRAASRAREASMIFATMIFASCGCSSRKSSSRLDNAASTIPLISEDTSLSLVCEENLGSGTLTDSTAVRPSRASSPVVVALFLLPTSLSIYVFSVRVSALRKPARCVPPSRCGMLLVKQNMLS